MSKKNYIPSRDTDFDTFFKNIIQYMALAWQNGKGQKGPWSEIQWTYVP